MALKPWVFLVGILLASLVATGALRVFGRPWTGEFFSHRWIDWWTWSHFGHGIVFCAVAKAIWPNASILWLLFVVVCVESAWEMLENTQPVIDWFRSRGDVTYEGDSVINSQIDRIACFTGALITAVGSNLWGGSGVPQ